MQTIKKKLDSLKDKRKARKQSAGNPTLVGPKLEADTSIQVKSLSDLPASEILSEGATAKEEMPAADPDPKQPLAFQTDIENFKIPHPIRISKSVQPETKTVEITPSVTPTPSSTSVDFNQHSLELAQLELKAVSETFDLNFHKFATKNTSFITFDAEIKSALAASHSETTIQLSAKQFRQQLSKVTQLNAQKSGLASHEWYNNVGSFVLSLYPAVRMTLGVTADVAGVIPTNMWPQRLTPLERRILALASWGQWLGFGLPGEFILEEIFIAAAGPREGKKGAVPENFGRDRSSVLQTHQQQTFRCYVRKDSTARTGNPSHDWHRQLSEFCPLVPLQRLR